MNKVPYKQWKSAAAGEPFVGKALGPASNTRSLEALLQQSIAMLYSQLMLSPPGPKRATSVTDTLRSKTIDILAECIGLAVGKTDVGEVILEKLTEYTEQLSSKIFKRKDFQFLLDDVTENESLEKPLRPIEIIERESKPFLLTNDSLQKTPPFVATDELISAIVQVRKFVLVDKRIEYTKGLSDLLYGILLSYIQFRVAEQDDDQEMAAQYALRIYREGGKLGQFIADNAVNQKETRKQLLAIEKLFSSTTTSSEVQSGIKPLTSRQLERSGADPQLDTKRGRELEFGPTK